MSQRIRNCSNSLGLDTVNCDSYLSRLSRHDKLVPRSKSDRAPSSVKPSKGEILLSDIPSNKIRSQKQMSKSKPVIHKEMIPNKPAVVEVTVRTRSSAQSDNTRSPWNKLLKASTPFDHFDPIRTVHFLSKELQTKLKGVSSSDPQVLHMLISMQEALNRIPPDVSASTMPLKISKSELRSCDKNGLQIQEVPEKLVIAPMVANKSCQTINAVTLTDSEIFQKKLESSTAKLETSCKQMEILCEQLKNEKQYVEELLQTETNKVATLKQRLEALQYEKNECSNTAYEKSLQERQEYENKLKQVIQIHSHQGPVIQELKVRINDLETQNMTLEQDNIALRHKLAGADMEKEKYVTLLNMRDRHINEILNEMNCLQVIVNDQLVQLQKVPSSPSTCVTLDNFTNPSSVDIDLIKAKDYKEVIEPSISQEKQQPVHFHQFCPKSSKDLESGDSSLSHFVSTNSRLILKKIESAPFPHKANILKGAEGGESTEKSGGRNIHELFNQVKQQAMNLNLPNPPDNKATTETRLHYASEPSTP